MVLCSSSLSSLSHKMIISYSVVRPSVCLGMQGTEVVGFGRWADTSIVFEICLRIGNHHIVTPHVESKLERKCKAYKYKEKTIL